MVPSARLAGVVDTFVMLGGQRRRIARVLRLEAIQPGERIGLVVDPLPQDVN